MLIEKIYWLLARVFSLVPVPGWLLVAGVLAYRILRSRGLGDDLGYAAARQLDHVVLGGLVVVSGLFGLIARGVSLSGLVAAVIVSGLYLSAFPGASRQTLWRMVALVAIVWMAIVYRYFHPVGPDLSMVHWVGLR